ncbi:MAG: KamA family protein [Salinivirgaceae bacterium]|nr:MAG: KamA family protein [Salinivirgaceae bacterium]
MERDLNKVAIQPKAQRVFHTLLKENPRLKEILKQSNDEEEARSAILEWAQELINNSESAKEFLQSDDNKRQAYEELSFKDKAAIRIFDYIKHTGRRIQDPSLSMADESILDPFGILWNAYQTGRGGAMYYFYLDMLFLFRQLNGNLVDKMPSKETIQEWMDRHPSGLDEIIVESHRQSRDRILTVILKKMQNGEIQDPKYKYNSEMSFEENMDVAINEWWTDRIFHLKFAARSPERINELLDHSLNKETMKIMMEAKEAGIPFFVNPYYLSLLNVEPTEYVGADLAIRDYIFYSRQLVDEFGHIQAWEKEDIVEPGKPNAAGWLLPEQHNVHRRYPEVAILIPDTVGRACAGLCSSCQRMYDFQSGHLNFNLDKLNPDEKWPDKLKRLMQYFEQDSQLRDILITGGDAFMNSDRSLRHILDEVYEMAYRKREANKKRPQGEKYAEMVRIRLGTRLLAYLPQRITPELKEILAEFKDKASKIGFKQFVVQTHFESALEVTPEVKIGVERLRSAGWTLTNQQVFTTAASRRGHTAKLRKVLNDIGILTYYTFSVKGFIENSHNFATNSRAMQEQREEKTIGFIPEEEYDNIRKFPEEAEHMIENINKLRDKLDAPFLATDRNVLNLPGVGKSQTFRVIGVTRVGKRVLEFDHDHTRTHSPILEKMDKFYIVESKPVGQYLEEIEEMGEDIQEYLTVYGYSIGETEHRMPIYEYPEYDFEMTGKMTNLEI